MISYLINDLKVPAAMITVESRLSHYGIQSPRRADIIIHGMDNDLMVPIAIIECKAPGVLLGEKAGTQAADYCDLLGCDYAMIVNDCACFAYHFDEEKNAYIRIEALPAYEELLENRFSAYDPGPFPERIHQKEISGYLKENPEALIGRDTEHRLACAAFNLFEGLMDPTHKLPKRKHDLFTLTEDYGVRMLTYGNAAGGSFCGPYRSFLIESGGSTEFVSITVSSYVSFAKPNIEKTAINVAIDNEKESHHALQLVLDDNVEYDGNRFAFLHHGRIAVGNQGSGKIDELRAYVAEIRPQLICGKKFFLGRLTNDRDWDLDDPEVVNLIENLISYALIRDEYRNDKKRLK